MYSSSFDYYPYNNYQNFQQAMPRRGFFNLFKRSNPGIGINPMKPKFDWGNFLSNTQKTLNVVNQAIPIIYQIKPIWANAKTMFKIVGALKDDDNTNKTATTPKFHPDENVEKEEKANFIGDNQPQFFI